MKVGDRVKLLDNVYMNDEDPDMRPGTLGVVRVGLREGFSYLTVELDIPVEGEHEWSFLPSELALVGEE